MERFPLVTTLIQVTSSRVCNTLIANQIKPIFCLLIFQLLIVSLSSRLPAQTDSDSTVVTPKLTPDRVRLVLIQGNDKTKEGIILREMKLKPGARLDLEELERDRLRIQNLGIFNRVEMDIVPTPEGAILVVSVTEMWYIFPYPVIFRNERDWDKLSWGAGLLHTNFRGRREVLDFSGWLGFNPALRLNYTNPWIFGRHRLYTQISIFGRRIRNRTFTSRDLIRVDENQLGFNFTLGKRFGHFTYFDVKTGYRQLTLSPDSVRATLSPSGKDKLPSLGFSFRYDSRDLWEYPHKGNYLNIWATKTGLGNTIDYLRYGIDLRKYFPLGKTTFAFRTATNFGNGSIPIYEQVHFGFLTRIRGHFRRREPGENLMIGSAEFRFPILPIKYFDWGSFGGIGQYGANWRLGLSGGLFFDTGKIWFQDSGINEPDFKSADFISGWGGGLHIFMPYNMLLRLEYGFNEEWNGQFIIDALVSF